MSSGKKIPLLIAVLIMLVLFPITGSKVYSDVNTIVGKELVMPGNEWQWLSRAAISDVFSRIPPFSVKRNRLHGDTVIADVERLIDSSELYYSKDDYLQAEKKLQQIWPLWQEYVKYCKKRHLDIKLDSLAIVKRTEDYRLLQTLYPEICKLDTIVKYLPHNKDDLVSHNRHDIQIVLEQCSVTIKDHESKYQFKKDIVTYGFRRSIAYLDSVERMFSDVYEQEKLNFSMKSKFYYNRAVESKDSVIFRQFVDDCDYYNVEKEWCERARKMLRPPEVDTLPVVKTETSFLVKTESSPVKVEKKTAEKPGKPPKMSVADSVHNEYKTVMESKSIEQLEMYVKKYSKRRISSSVTKIDSVKKTLEAMKKELQAEITYAKQYPLFSNGSVSDIQVVVKGLSMVSENAYRAALASLGDELKNATGIRFPATLVIDYVRKPSMLFLTANVNIQKDIVSQISGDTSSYVLAGNRWAMQFLNMLKNRAISMVQSSDSLGETAKEKEIEMVKFAAYVNRLKKNEIENITLYGHEAMGKSASINSVEYYSFFDISTLTAKDVRFVNSTAERIQIVPANIVDSVRTNRVIEFFR